MKSPQLPRPRRDETCSPGEHSHSDRRNFTADDYLQMCRDGGAEWSLAEYARLAGVSRMRLHRQLLLASIPEDEFNQLLDEMQAAGKALSLTAVSDEVKRSTGRARNYVECCPHCGGVLRKRRR